MVRKRTTSKPKPSLASRAALEFRMIGEYSSDKLTPRRKLNRKNLMELRSNKNKIKLANHEIKQLKDAKLIDDKLEKNLGKKGRLHSKSFYNDLIKRQQDIINNNKPATLTSLAKKHAMKLSGITTFLSTLLSASPAYDKGGKVK